MDNKNCLNCKWYYSKKCNCNDFTGNIMIETKQDGTTYVEDGILSETIRENFKFKELANLIIDKLRDEDYLKKNKNINKFNIEDLENDITEMIDCALSGGIMNYFDGSLFDANLEINEPREFSCCYWE